MGSISEEMGVLVGQFNVVQSLITANPATTPVQLCPANALRWAVLIGSPVVTSTGAQNIGFVGITKGNASQFIGMPLVTSVGYLNWNYRDVGALVQQALFGVSTAAASLVWTVIEILIQQ